MEGGREESSKGFLKQTCGPTRVVQLVHKLVKRRLRALLLLDRKRNFFPKRFSPHLACEWVPSLASVFGDISNISMSLTAQLKTAWVNEHCAPEILLFNAQLVEQTLDRLEDQKETHIMGNEKGGEKLIYQMEFDRLKYSLTCYLRFRLRKVEQHARFIADTPELHARLSTAELSHMTSFLQIKDACLGQIFLNRLPEHVRSLNETEMVQEPRTDSYVFAEILDDVGSIDIDGGQEQIELSRGDLVAIKYRTVQALVLRNVAKLV